MCVKGYKNLIFKQTIFGRQAWGKEIKSNYSGFKD